MSSGFEVDYTVDPGRGDALYAAIRTYRPELRNGALQPGCAGIRPKISGPEEPAVDFVVQGPEIHVVPGLVNLYGIESPGLTASMPLAEQVLRRLTSTATEPVRERENRRGFSPTPPALSLD